MRQADYVERAAIALSFFEVVCTECPKSPALASYQIRIQTPFGPQLEIDVVNCPKGRQRRSMTIDGFTDSLGYLNEKYYLAERLLATHSGPIKERPLNVAVSIPLGELKPGSGIPSSVVKLIGSIPARLNANNDDSGHGSAAVTLETMSEEVALAIAHDICEVHDQLRALEEEGR